MTANNQIRDRIAEAVIALAIATGAWWVIALPAHDRLAAAQACVDNAQAELDALDTSDAPDLDRIAAVHATLQSWNAALTDPLTAGERLQHAADTAGVRIDRLAPADEPELSVRGAVSTAVHRFELVASGPTASLARMLDLVSLQPLVSVRTFDLAPGASAEEIIAVVIIELSEVTIAESIAEEITP